MALKLADIQALADRVAASHGLAVVDLEYQGGGGKHRTLRVFIEKNERERANLRERVTLLQARQAGTSGEESGPGGESEKFPKSIGESGSGETADASAGGLPAQPDEDQAFLDGLPSVANLEYLSGITHADCELFSQDFGTVLDIEELVPGTEYLLEISSPGLDRRLTGTSDYRRFAGSQAKLQTFEAVAGSRHWQGRIGEIRGDTVVLEVGGKQERKRAKKGSPSAPEKIEIALSNVEKAHLVPEF